MAPEGETSARILHIAPSHPTAPEPYLPWNDQNMRQIHSLQAELTSLPQAFYS